MDILNPFDKNLIKVETEFCGRPLSLEINRLAFRSQAAVLATYGETVVLANVNVNTNNSNLDYFPLSVDYEERFYAAGKISGSRFIKRSGRPSDDAILTSRLIDRPIRPLFPKGYRQEVQAIITVLSLDPQIRADALSMIAASAAMSLTGAPFKGPISGLRVAIAGDSLVVYPTKDQQQQSSLDIMVASNKDGVMMIEASAKEVAEKTVVEAMEIAHQHNQKIIALQEELIAKVKPQPLEYELFLPDQEIKSKTQAWLSKQPSPLDGGYNYAQRLSKTEELRQNFKIFLEDELEQDVLAEKESLYLEALEISLNQSIRDKIIKDKKRLDGRNYDQIRPLTSQVSVLPRTHGSAIFTRGATQALNIVTLGPPSLSQALDTMERDEEKTFFHHYNAPGYTLGEAKRLSGPGRREIGHSYLAEKALSAVIPSQEEFPYTIWTVTEIMSQQGSTSMAATCSAALALMDAGIPIKAPVSGVAMGLILTDSEDPLILTDIADAEDFAGDMDLKVAGTAEGITALQMDMKVPGLSVSLLAQALNQSKAGRQEILNHMLSVLPRFREKLSPVAPRVCRIKISVSKIKDVIGKGGETIHALTAETGAQIDVKDDGQIFIFSNDEAIMQAATDKIKALTEDPEVGRIYRQKPIVKITDFGVFVNFIQGHDGMVHVSEMRSERVNHPKDICKEGDKVDVKLIAIDDQGRYSLSIKRV